MRHQQVLSALEDHCEEDSQLQEDAQEFVSLAVSAEGKRYWGNFPDSKSLIKDFDRFREFRTEKELGQLES